MADYQSSHSGSTIDTRVSQVSTNTADIAALKSRMNTAEAEIDTKADATSITSINSRLGGIEAKIPSAATTSNKLADKAYVDSISSGLESAISGKADASALASVSSRVGTIEGKIPSSATSSNQLADKSFVNSGLSTKQATLQSGTNIKTINGESILGSGDISVGGSGAVFSAEFKSALLACLRGVAWVGDNGASLINALDAAMNRADLLRIEATYTQTNVVYPSSSMDDIKEDLVVIAYYTDGTHLEIDGYSLSGTLSVGVSTITVTYSGKTDTIQVTVSEKDYYSLADGDLIKLGATTTLNATKGWYLTESTFQAGRRRSFPISAGVKSFRLTEDDVTFIDDTNYYPIEIPAGTTSIKTDITPSSQYFAVVLAAYSNGSYGASLLDTGWQQGSYTISTIPSGATHLSVASKYDSSGTSYPTEPSDLKITFIKNE